MYDIGYVDGASTSKAKGTNCFVKNSVITNHVVRIAKKALKKKNVLRLERILIAIIVELNDTFDPIVISCEVHQNKSNGKYRRKSHQ